MRKNKFIGIYGAASENIDSFYKENAEVLSYNLAKNGYDMVFGGGATGLMGASARGFIKGGAYVIGVVPAFMDTMEEPCKDVSKTIQVDSMAERKSVIEGIADIFIVLPGGIGTYDEMFQIMTQVMLHRKEAKIILFNDHDFFNPIVDLLEDGMNKNFIRRSIWNYIKVADTVEDVLWEVKNEIG